MRHGAALGLALGVGLLGGCTASERAGVRQNVQGMRQEVGQAAADAALAGKVKTALSTRKGLETPKSHIDVEAKSGRVVLKGDVASREQAELAEQVALQTAGVNSVDNQLMLRIPAKTPGSPAGTQPTTPGASGTVPPGH